MPACNYASPEYTITFERTADGYNATSLGFWDFDRSNNTLKIESTNLSDGTKWYEIKIKIAYDFDPSFGG